jgi:glycosyltransferase involved in cell wall biosynthesis
MAQDIELSVVIPCLNEDETLEICIRKALTSFKQMNIHGEVVIADNGSTDRSVSIAESLGARVIHQPLKGYGNALHKGILESRGKYIIMGDADDSYDFSDIERFVNKLREGYDVVMGTRLKGTIKKGAMPWLHQYFGNPALTWLVNLFFKPGISDIFCGLRAFTKAAYIQMNLRTAGMEFAPEFVIKAAKENLKITEIPITYFKDGRSHRSHLRSFHDGWRTLRFLLMYSPTYLYFIPGMFFFMTGLLLELIMLKGPLHLASFTFDTHFNILGCVLAVMGFQILALGLFSKVFAHFNGFDKHDKLTILFLKLFKLERGIYLGFCVALVGLILFLYILFSWIHSDFKGIFEIRKALLATTLCVVGFEIFLSSFFVSMLSMELTERKEPPTV